MELNVQNLICIRFITSIVHVNITRVKTTFQCLNTGKEGFVENVV